MTTHEDDAEKTNPSGQHLAAAPIIELPSPSGFDAMMGEFRSFRLEIRTEISTMTGYCKDAADNAFQAVSEGRIGMGKLQTELEKTSKRVTVLELRRQIMPTVAWLVSISLTLWALARTYR